MFVRKSLAVISPEGSFSRAPLGLSAMRSFGGQGNSSFLESSTAFESYTIRMT